MSGIELSLFHWEKDGGMWEWGRGGSPLTSHENVIACISVLRPC